MLAGESVSVGINWAGDGGSGPGSAIFTTATTFDVEKA